MRICIIGYGFLGKELFTQLRKRHHVTVLSRSVETRGVFHQADATQYDQLRARIPKRTQIIVNCVAHISFRRKDAPLLHKINVESTRNILRCCVDMNVDHYVHVSSITCFGHCTPQNPVLRENNFGNIDHIQNNPYSMSKYNSEILVREYESKLNKLSIIYPGIIIGPGNPPFRSLIRKMHRVPFATDKIIPLVDCRDCARAIILTLRRPGQYIIVSMNVKLNVFMERMLEEMHGEKIHVRLIPESFYTSMYVFACVFENVLPISACQVKQIHCNRKASGERARKMLGWRPLYSLEQSIRAMCS